MSEDSVMRVERDIAARLLDMGCDHEDARKVERVLNRSVARAATPWERVDHDGLKPEDGESPDSDRARWTLKTWSDAVGGDDAFAERLKRVGRTQDEARRGALAHRVSDPSALPPWSDEFKGFMLDLYRRDAELDDAAKATLAAARADERVHGGTARLLAADALRDVGVYAPRVAASMDAQAVEADIASYARSRVSGGMLGAMILGKTADAGGAAVAPDKRYAMESLKPYAPSDFASWLNAASQFPGVTRILGILRLHLRLTMREALERLDADLDFLAAEAFGAEASALRLLGLEGGLGDHHNEGRSVIRFDFNLGKAYHKPKDLRVSAEGMAAIRDLSALSGDPLRTTRIHPRGDYAWEEHVAVKPVDAESDADAADAAAESDSDVGSKGPPLFYRRLGRWTAILQMMGASDFWLDNLIAAGDHPIFIDYETIFQQGTGANRMLRSLRYREIGGDESDWPMSTGVLPLFIGSGELGASRLSSDLGCLGAPGAFFIPSSPSSSSPSSSSSSRGDDDASRRDVAESDAESDAESFAESFAETFGDAVGVAAGQVESQFAHAISVGEHLHLPRFADGDFAWGGLHLDEFLDGYDSMLESLRSESARDIFERMLDRVGDAPGRFILINTFAGYDLNRLASSGAGLFDGVSALVSLENYWRRVFGAPDDSQFPSEMRDDVFDDAMALDIPLFYGRCGELSLETPRGTRVDNYLERTGADLIRSRLRVFAESDETVEESRRYTSASAGCTRAAPFAGFSHPDARSRIAPRSRTTPSADVLDDEARRIAETLGRRWTESTTPMGMSLDYYGGTPYAGPLLPFYLNGGLAASLALRLAESRSSSDAESSSLRGMREAIHESLDGIESLVSSSGGSESAGLIGMLTGVGARLHGASRAGDVDESFCRSALELVAERMSRGDERGATLGGYAAGYSGLLIAAGALRRDHPTWSEWIEPAAESIASSVSSVRRWTMTPPFAAWESLRGMPVIDEERAFREAAVLWSDRPSWVEMLRGDGERWRRAFDADVERYGFGLRGVRRPAERDRRIALGSALLETSARSRGESDSEVFVRAVAAAREAIDSDVDVLSTSDASPGFVDLDALWLSLSALEFDLGSRAAGRLLDRRDASGRWFFGEYADDIYFYGAPGGLSWLSLGFFRLAEGMRSGSLSVEAFEPMAW